MQCGDIRYKVDSLKFNKKLNILMKVIAKKGHLNFTNLNVDNYELNEINDLIAKNIVRSEKIIKDVKKEYNNGKKYIDFNRTTITDELYI